MEPPLADITENLVNSPMSVSSNKSDGSLSDIRRLTALSLTIHSPPPIMQKGAGTPQTPLCNNSVAGATGVLNADSLTPISDAVALATEEGEEENINHNNNLFGLEDEISKASFIDAFLKGIMTSDFGGGDALNAPRRNSSTSSDALMRGDEDLLDIDLLDENVLFNMIDDENQENEADQQQRGGGAIMMKDELGAILEDDDDILNSSTGSVENSILQRSISSPSGVWGGGKPHLAAGASGPQSPRLRRSASLVDNNVSNSRPGSRKPAPENIAVNATAAKTKKRTPKKPRISRMKSDSALASRGSTAGAAHPYLSVGVGRSSVADIPPELRRRHTVSGGGGGRLYFENKEYFKIRSHLRDLVRKGHNNQELPMIPEMKGSLAKMKSARLFLGMLTKHCTWAAESVKATTPVSPSEPRIGGEEADGAGQVVVVEEQDTKINMENFTKRQITVLNDIPPERVCFILTLF